MHSLMNIFYRAYGVRYAATLMELPEVKFDKLPRSALFHFVPEEGGRPWVDTSLPIFQGYSRKILVDDVSEYSVTEGGARRPMLDMKAMSRAFRKNNVRSWTITPNPWLVDQNPETLIVMNYGYLDVAYKYLTTQMAEYYKWLNRQRTVWTKASEIAKASDRNQFIIFPIASVLQGRSILDKFSDKPVSLASMQIFGNSGSAGFMQLDMWRWLSLKSRTKSLLNLIDPENYNRINLVFQGTSGKQTIVNLGYLNSWIKGQPNMTDLTSVSQVAVTQIQNLFLRLCMDLNSMTEDQMQKTENAQEEIVGKPAPFTVAYEPEAIGSTEDPSDDIDSENGNSDEESTNLEKIGEVSDAHHSAITGKTAVNKLQLMKSEKNDSLVMPDITSSLMKDLEKDIEMLDRLSLRQLQNSGIKMQAIDEEQNEPPIDPSVIRARVFTPRPPNELLREKMDRDAEGNLLTAADYRKLVETTKAYQASPDPYGSKLPRVQAMVIAPEDTQITENTSAIVTSDSVPDKTMSASSLINYDRQYVKKVYKKDILRALDALQSAGVTIRRHEIDVSHSALGTYEHHSLELKPIDGAPSSLQFTLPRIEEDGTFLAGGNKYLMRKQRVD